MVVRASSAFDAGHLYPNQLHTVSTILDHIVVKPEKHWALGVCAFVLKKFTNARLYIQH